MDGLRTSFEITWPAHFAYTSGHPIGNPPPPKLMEAVLLFEQESRAREALQLQRQREERERTERRGHGKRVLARGR